MVYNKAMISQNYKYIYNI